MQQTLSGCASARRCPVLTLARNTGGERRLGHPPICVDCAIQARPDPDERDHHACDGCGLVVDTLAALTRFRVELGHLKGALQLYARCSPGGPAHALDA